MRRIPVLALAAAVAAGAATPAFAVVGERLPAGLARLSPAEVAQRVQVIDDPLEDHVVFSTRAVFRKGGFQDDVAVHDGFLEARRLRSGEAVVWRVRHDLSYAGARREVTQIHLNTPDGLLKLAPSAVRRWAEDCGEAGAACGQRLTVEFDLPETAVRHIAAAWRPGDRTPWRVRFKDAHGQDVTVGLSPAEVAGLVAAVEAARR